MTVDRHDGWIGLHGITIKKWLTSPNYALQS
jgi:hypothetical protein